VKINWIVSFARVAYNARRSPRPPVDAPLVSVVIATFNWSSVLRYAITSALWQTYPAVEVLVIGDACTDDSEAVVASFDDPRVRWHNLPENCGSQSGPNQVGLGLARGEYIAYLGHDDVWLPTHLALLMEGVRRTGAGIAQTRCEYIGPGGRYRKLHGSPPSAIIHETQLGRETGWRDWREITAAPDADFIARASERAGGMLTVQKLTVFKFPSVWRQNSYVDKPSHEQRLYVERIRRERSFVYGEIAGLALAKLRRADFPIKQLTPPGEVPPGWYVAQARKHRGLD
jgi:glycosyltransferase involved in cell wall biosynthesis